MMGYCVARGAFIIADVIAETPECRRIEKVVDPIKDKFSAVIFVAVGMMIDPRLIAEHATPVRMIVRRSMGIRAILVHFIFVAAILPSAMLVLVMSSSILPPWLVAVVNLAGPLVAAIIQGRTLTQICSRARIALCDTLSAAAHEEGEAKH